MIDTEALRKKVIDLAIQGKLTVQLPSDGDAETLYAQIQDQKSQLIKEGKLKKDKALPDIAADEVPFEIPNNWKWVRFGTIITLQSGQDLNANDYNSENNGIPYITGASNYRDDGSLIINRWTDSPKAFAQKGDILLSCKGTVGKLTILDEEEVHIARQIMGIRTYSVSILFIRYFVDCMIERIKSASKGLIPGIERNDILSLCCPLPPITEQKRIVERIENVLTEIDVIDNLQAKYSNDLVVLKSKIIDAGISGKLTEQLPEDGDAETLYSQIQKGKEKLIREKKIKDQKTKPVTKEVPFSIPNNWKWVRIGSIEEINLGFTYRPEYVEEGVYFLSAKDITGGKVDFTEAKKVSEDTYKNAAYGSKPRKGDVLFCRVGTLGKPQVIYDDTKFCIFVSLGFFRDHFSLIEQEYIALWMRSKMFERQVDIEVKGALQRNLNTGWLKEFFLPLPPHDEQKRIVEKVTELLSILE